MRSTTQAALAFAGALAATIAVAQQPQTVRLRGVIEKVDGHTVLAKLTKGDEIKLNLADNVLVVGVVKASVADIKEGEFIGSGAIPQPDGSQKAIEAGSAFTVIAAVPKTDGSFDASRINVGRNGASPP